MNYEMEYQLKRLKTKGEKWAYLMGYNAGFIAMKSETENIISDMTEKAMSKLIHTEMTLRLSTEEE